MSEPVWVEQIFRVSRRRNVVLHWPSDMTHGEAVRCRLVLARFSDFLVAMFERPVKHRPDPHAWRFG